MITLNERSGIVIQEIYPLIAGVGFGMLFHTPFQVVTNSLPKRDLAQATGAFFLVRFMGTTTGLVSVSLLAIWLLSLTNTFAYCSQLPVRCSTVTGWHANQQGSCPCPIIRSSSIFVHLFT